MREGDQDNARSREGVKGRHREVGEKQGTPVSRSRQRPGVSARASTRRKAGTAREDGRWGAHRVIAPGGGEEEPGNTAQLWAESYCLMLF